MQGVRWNRAERHFEGRCDACSEWWPLDPDVRDVFWPVDGRGLRICRACDRLKSAARTAMLRESPSYRDRERGYSMAYYRSLSPRERIALRRSQPGVVDNQRRWTRTSRARSEGRLPPKVA